MYEKYKNYVNKTKPITQLLDAFIAGLFIGCVWIIGYWIYMWETTHTIV